jgi:hypothetical protein
MWIKTERRKKKQRKEIREKQIEEDGLRIKKRSW